LLEYAPTHRLSTASSTKKILKTNSVEILNQASAHGIMLKTVFYRYRKGGISPLVRDGGHEKIPMVSSLFHSGGAM
jgi:hypothetical protein